jgi:ABC-type proline/glycine betaine transport system permease subunit
LNDCRYVWFGSRAVSGVHDHFRIFAFSPVLALTILNLIALKGEMLCRSIAEVAEQSQQTTKVDLQLALDKT